MDQQSPESDVVAGATTDGLPIAPSLGLALEAVHAPRLSSLVDKRVVRISALAIVVAFGAAAVARIMIALIGLVTSIAFYGRVSLEFVSPAQNHLGLFVILVPVAGGIIVGLMARYGSAAIRGHGIPEAMEQVLLNQSRIPPRLTFLKPVSSAIAMGTGGPFGAEGPIIATGGALGSLVGQLLETTATERKTLLAAGAAAGMAAIFGSPVAAVLLAIELLLFEYRPRTLIPVALASVTAAGVRYATVGTAPAFALPTLTQPGAEALVFYVLVGAIAGFASVYVTRLVYWIEDLFEHLHVHWMWWPALGGIVVGVVGYFVPRTLGVGYDNISDIISGTIVGRALVVLFVMKLVSWSVALGSGTSGGTLAPLFTIGGGLGAALGEITARLWPQAGIDPRIAALVGMAALFAGASRALLTSVVFAFETTLQPVGLLPLLGGCSAAYVVSALMMRHTIMTEKLARRGVRVPAEYTADFLEQVPVSEVASSPVITLCAEDSLEIVRAWLDSDAPEAHHQGFPVIDEQDQVLGVVTRRDLLDHALPDETLVSDAIKKRPIVIHEHHSVREAADHMARENVGRLLVLSNTTPPRMVGIITRGDLLAAHARRLRESHDATRGLRVMDAIGSRRRAS